MATRRDKKPGGEAVKRSPEARRKKTVAEFNVKVGHVYPRPPVVSLNKGRETVHVPTGFFTDEVEANERLVVIIRRRG